MKLRKKVFMGLTLATCISILGACGGDSKDNASENDTGKKEVIFWGSWNGNQVDQLNEIITKYNDSQDKYKVEYQVQPQVGQKLLTAMSGGEVPDVIMWDRVDTPTYATKNALLSLDDYIKKDNVNLDDFYPETVDEMNYDGKQYGVPLLVDSRCLYYNKKLLSEAGVEPPKTWDELATVAEKTTKWDGKKLVQSGFALDKLGMFNAWIAQAGGQMLSDDQSKTAFNSPEGKKVLEFWNELLNDKKVYQVGFSNTNTDAFAAGKVALAYNSFSAMNNYDKVEGLDYGVVPPVSGPDGGKGAIAGGFGLVIPKPAKNQDGAWDFIKWWTTNPDILLEFSKISDWLPANVKAANNDYFVKNEKYEAFVETMNFATTRPKVPEYHNVEDLALIPQLENFVTGKVTADKALELAQERGDQLLAGNDTKN